MVAKKLEKVVPVLVSKIKIPKDYIRKDLGDLDPLSESISGSNGLLQPIRVSKNFTLLLGRRRLAAAKKAGMKTINCIIGDLPEDLQAQSDENKLRKELTLSEMAEEKRRIEERMGNRRGERTDLKDGEKKVEGETREIAAKEAGFDTEFQARQAEKVVNKGTPELRQAMDNETVSLSTAAAAAELPAPSQRKVAKVAEKEGTRAASEAVKLEQQSLLDRRGSQKLRDAVKSGVIALGKAAQLAKLPIPEQNATVDKLIEKQATAAAAPEEPEKGKGKKGKNGKKQGAPKFDDRPIRMAIDKLSKLLTHRQVKLGDSPGYRTCVDALQNLNNAFAEWQKLTK